MNCEANLQSIEKYRQSLISMELEAFDNPKSKSSVKIRRYVRNRVRQYKGLMLSSTEG